MLSAAGLSGPLLIVVLVLALGWLMVKAVLQAWEALLDRMKGTALAAVRDHADTCPAKLARDGDELFKREVREGFRQVTEDIRAVHQRIDEFLQAEIERRRHG